MLFSSTQDISYKPQAVSHKPKAKIKGCAKAVLLAAYSLKLAAIFMTSSFQPPL
jgi:hypothetical protein